MSCDSWWFVSHLDFGFMVSCWCLESYTGRNVTFMLVISSPLWDLLGFLSVFATMLCAFTPCCLLTDLQVHVMSKFSMYCAFHICHVPILLLCSPKEQKHPLTFCPNLHLFKQTICLVLHLCSPQCHPDIPCVNFLCSVLCPFLKGSTTAPDLYLSVLHHSHKTMAGPYEEKKASQLEN